ncbi:MAG TPA: carbohydrate ABC transporter permease [Chloroflexia bacterium]|nr:carbohydrate ABC transporter permease [Chloroflexia bacterium]
MATTTVQTRTAGSRRSKITSGILVNGILLIICLLWIIPSFGLLVSSFRTRDDILSSGWWTIFPHQEYQSVSKVQLKAGLPLDQPIQIPDLGVTVTDDQLVAGYKLPDGRQVKWANRRSRLVDVQQQQWTSNAHFTLDNYSNVIVGQSVTIKNSDGTSTTEQGQNLGSAFLNSLTVAVPATIIPILIAAFAAYAFAWMRFWGRRLMFGIVIAMLVVPLQVALIPILQDYTKLGITGTYLAVWIAHTAFGLPLAIYLLFNFISQLPREIIESAFIDGASNFTIFLRLILPLSVPALASFAIFQFLWVWNDYLVALIFLGGTTDVQVLTQRLANIVGSRGEAWHLLTAGAFISMIVPLIVFFALQRFFVRGLMAGSVKG